MRQRHHRTEREERERESEAQPAPPLAAPQHIAEVLRMQRTLGNHSVATSLRCTIGP